MASMPRFSLLKFSLGASVPLLIDLAYQEGYLVPSTTPNLYNKSRWKELSQPTRHPFRIPPSLTFVGYRTENPFHVEYVHAKKSLWRYNVMWSLLGVVTTTFQANYIVNALQARRIAGAIAALSAIGLTWTAIVAEGHARRMYLDEMQKKVLKEEEAFSS
jgi:hypothetical protein